MPLNFPLPGRSVLAVGLDSRQTLLVAVSPFVMVVSLLVSVRMPTPQCGDRRIRRVHRFGHGALYPRMESVLLNSVAYRAKRPLRKNTALLSPATGLELEIDPTS
jgi:hypothetical protein